MDHAKTGQRRGRNVWTKCDLSLLFLMKGGCLMGHTLLASLEE